MIFQSLGTNNGNRTDIQQRYHYMKSSNNTYIPCLTRFIFPCRLKLERNSSHEIQNNIGTHSCRMDWYVHTPSSNPAHRFARYQRQFFRHSDMGLFIVYHCGIHYNDALSSFYKIQTRRHLAFCCSNFTVFAACCRSCGRYCYIFCLCCSSRYCFVLPTAPNTKLSHSNTW